MTDVRTASVPDAYARLGLAPGASLNDVKQAYRRLAMRFHPDRAGAQGVAAFLDLKAAYEWIVAHPSLGEPGDRRRGFVTRTRAARPVRGTRPVAARPAPAPATARSTWPGGRWYWEGIRDRAARRHEPAAPANTAARRRVSPRPPVER
jgi:hypothetical protein